MMTTAFCCVFCWQICHPTKVKFKFEASPRLLIKCLLSDFTHDCLLIIYFIIRIHDRYTSLSYNIIISKLQ